MNVYYVTIGDETSIHQSTDDVDVSNENQI